MSQQIPITPSLLTWARERAGLSKADITQKFKHFAEWEQGLSFPTYPQLEQLADIFKVPIAVFFFPAPPKLPPITETFRTLPKSELDNLPSRMRFLLRKAKAMQLNLLELTDGKNPAEHLITKELIVAPNSTVVDMAAAARLHIGVSIEDQRNWRDMDTALKEWRSALLRAGVFVFKDAFKLEEYFGFCLYDEVFPIIYVNNSSTKTRQIFTYFHELAHLLFHTSGIYPVDDSFIANLEVNSKRIETLCNEFAAEFLVPDKDFRSLSSGVEASEAVTEQLAQQFHVSREVVFRRFLDHGRITDGQYTQAVRRWNEQRQLGTSKGGDHYRTKLSYLGREYVSLALAQYHQNRIDQNQLADYLDTKPKNVNTLEEYFHKGPV